MGILHLTRRITVTYAILIITTGIIAGEDVSKKTVQDSIKRLRTEAISQAGKGMYNESLKNFNTILHLKQTIYPEDHAEIAHTLMNIGVIYKKQGNYDKALTHYQKAEDIYEKQEGTDPRKLGTNYSNMANIFSHQKDFEKAEIYYQKALNLYQMDSVKNQDRLASLYNNLGILYNEFQQYEKALLHYQKSLEIKEHIGATSIVNTLGNMAVSYQKTGNYDKAKEFHLHTIEIIKKTEGIDSYNLAVEYMNYGVFLMNLNKLEEAEDYFKSAKHIYKKFLGKHHYKTALVYLNLGDLASRRSDPYKALNFYQKGLIAISENFSDTSIYSYPEISETSLKTDFLELLKKKADKFYRLGQTDHKYYKEALKTYDLAIETTKTIRKGFLSEDSKLLLTAEERDTYMRAMITALKLHKETHDEQYFRKAFTYAEGSKASVLYEAIQSSQALSIGNIPDTLKAEENQIKKRIFYLEELVFEEKQNPKPNSKQLSYWNNELFKLNKKYEALISEIEKKYPRFYELKYNFEPVDLGKIHDKIGRDEILVEYVVHDNTIYAFLLGKEEYKVEQTQIDSTFSTVVRRLRESLSERNFSRLNSEIFQNYVDTSYYLYSKLIKPLNIPKEKKVTIIPDDILSYIPFETLVTQHTQRSDLKYSKLNFLIHDYPVGYAYSAKTLFNSPVYHQKPNKKLAAFAPTYENVENLEDLKFTTRQKYREKLYPLKGIKEEAKKITKIIAGDIFADDEATEQRFKENSPDYDILHLAMHTLVNDNDPMFSKMAFTQKGSETEDGFLNTYEIYNLSLSSRMTVLSSCNTGVGTLRRGEGVMSLARGFKYAGCPSIVMTLWPVEDNSSIKLMEYFYEAVKKGKEKDAALRYAKLKFLENSDKLHAHPYFWSGYILIGDKSAIYPSAFRKYIITGAGLLLVIMALIWIRKKKMNRN